MDQKQKLKTVCIDFDRTLMDHQNVAPGHKMGYPEPHAVEAVNALWSRGYHIVILTARRPAEHRIVEQWLRHFQIPFNQVTNVKPEALCYIDDRAIRYEDNWLQILDWVDRVDINPEVKL